jgi:hypothetical protein
MSDFFYIFPKKLVHSELKTMKRSFLLALCLSAAAAFAGAYDISDFSAKDEVSADSYATNNGNALNTATVDEATSVPSGNVVLRQKFVRESGINAYQLYMGRAQDLSSMTALSVPSKITYKDVIKAKLYERRGMKPGDDFEKVYFDGKFVYVPGASTAFATVKGAPVELKGEAPAAAKSDDAPKKVCEDEFDMSCDDDIETYKSSNNVDVSGDLNRSNSYADSRDYSASAAAQDVKDRFGIADEVRFWSAVALSAVAAGSAVMGILQHMKSSEANKAYKELQGVANTVENKIKSACSTIEGVTNQQACINHFKTTTDPKAFIAQESGWTYAKLQSRMKTDKDTQDSYAMGRNLWFGVTAVSLTTAIVLFAW